MDGWRMDEAIRTFNPLIVLTLQQAGKGVLGASHTYLYKTPLKLARFTDMCTHFRDEEPEA